MGTFDGHVALVTGAGQGLGAAIAKELGAGGAAVVATDINLAASAPPLTSWEPWILRPGIG